MSYDGCRTSTIDGVHKMMIVCRNCEERAKYNDMLGIYYCPTHGFDTTLWDESAHMQRITQNVEKMVGEGLSGNFTDAQATECY